MVHDMKRKKNKKKNLLKAIRTGIRLNTPPPRVLTPDTVYNRKKKEPVDKDGLYFCIRTGSSMLDQRTALSTSSSRP